ncbi:MAG TPA: hypothetical protein VIU12_14535 [Chryseolinea sp.]
MEKKTKSKTARKARAGKTGPKDRDYVNHSQEHEVRYEPKRKTPAKKFGS